ncbi:butyrophilin-like protein 2 [Centroberyx gerrardi]
MFLSLKKKKRLPTTHSRLVRTSSFIQFSDLIMNGKVGLIVLIILNVTHGAENPKVIGHPKPIEAVVGDDVILPCHLKPPSDVTNLTVEWKVNGSVVHVYRHGGDSHDIQDKRFENRTSLLPEEMTKGNISLKLSSVQLSDTGHYKCFVPHWRDKKGLVDLTVVLKVTEHKSNRTEDRDHENKEPDVEKKYIVFGVIGILLLVGVVGLWAVKRRLAYFTWFFLSLKRQKTSSFIQFPDLIMNGKVGPIVLIILTIAHGAEKPEVIGSLQPIDAVVGDDVILPCHVEPQSDVTKLTVDWKVNGSLVHVYRHRGDRPDMQDKRFENRTSLFHEEMTKGNISLKLSSVQLSDTGHYKCFVPHWRDKKGLVDLTVVPKVTEDKSNRTEERHESKEPDVEKIDIGIIIGVVIGVLLLVGVVGLWAVKRCQSRQQVKRKNTEVIGSLQRIEAAVGDHVILPCHLEPPSDATNLTVEWKVNGSFVHVYRHGGDSHDIPDKQFENRTFLFHKEMTKGNISLKLSSVQQSDAGNYTCFVTKWKGKKGSVNLTVVLKVTEDKSNRTKDRDHENKEPDGEKMDIGKIVGIVFGVVIGVLLLVGVAVAVGLWAVKKRQSTQQAERSRDAGDPREMDNMMPQTTETPAESNLTNELPEV